MRTLLFIAFLGCHSLLNAQNVLAPNGYWTARWIQPAGEGLSQRAYGVYHFRKSFDLADVPERFVIHMSADNRYRLFVNGQDIGIGPARGDTQHWYYDTYDLAPYLQSGRNTLAVQVWNMGDHAPVAQWSHQTGLIVEGELTASIINTDKTWKCLQNISYQPVINDNNKLWTYIVVGPGDRVDAARYPWGWQQTQFDDSAWPAAVLYSFPAKMRGFGTDGNWAMMPRPIPQLWSCPERLGVIRRVEGGQLVVPDSFLAGKAPLRIPANQHVTILFDQQYLTNGYPQVVTSGGRSSSIRMGYAEGMMDKNKQKHHRDSINGLQLIGVEDEFLPDGGTKRHFVPLWFRTWRYLQLDITTGADPLVIDDIYGVFTGYPFTENARFASSDPSLKDIWDTGWRTARLCAGETYFDCPYYEQLQYTGDTRIQALISLYVSGDDRLMRKAIQDFADSRISDGLTQSRYPCNDPQVIPTFSLFWVSMVHDYWMHRSDDVFVQRQLNTVSSVLDWHISRMGQDGLNGPLEWWNFVDWCWPWSETDRIGGVPPGARGGSSILSLQQAITLEQAAELMGHYGRLDLASKYRSLAQRIRTAVWSTCWDAQRGLLADTPQKQSFSQHANIFGVLSGAIPDSTQKGVLQRVMADKSLTQATLYFRFYLFEALHKTGMGDQFLPQLAPWYTMLDRGLTTFAEQADPTRSDCHAWSASPNYELLSLVCGVRPAEPGFGRVTVTPRLGTLKFVECALPHPSGTISLLFVPQENGRLAGQITLPDGVSGQLIWQGKVIALRSGRNEL
jgi:alpha-L-rhamnosidase